VTLEARKTEARRAAFARRKVAFDAGHSSPAAHLSEVLAGYRGVATAGYMPINTEIDPLPAMEEHAAHGPIGVPVIEGAGKPLTFARWEPGCDMVVGAFKALIPANVVPMVPEILIVPLVAFDRTGGRLGYGGGFYDRTLEGLRAKGPALAIGFAWSAQEAAALPLEATDQPLDFLITEKQVITFS